MSETLSARDEARSTWQRNANRARVTERGRIHYHNVFDIQKGERVLDLGPGRSPYVPKDSVRLDNIFNERYKPGKGNNIAGLFQELPLLDDSFDRAVASYSLFWVRRGIKGVTRESLRVLRPEGVLQIFPAQPTDTEAAKQLADEGITSFRRLSRFSIGLALVTGGIEGIVTSELTHIDSTTSIVEAGIETAETFIEGNIARSGGTLSIHKSQIPEDPVLQEFTLSRILDAYQYHELWNKTYDELRGQ